jgi:hypothetical protein
MQVLVDKDGLQRHPRPQRNVIPYYSRELDNLEKKKETRDFFTTNPPRCIFRQRSSINSDAKLLVTAGAKSFVISGE